jgi:glycosyltransferase involved in cell wall biosynthesis
MLADEESIKQSEIRVVTNWIFKPNDFEDLFKHITSAIHDPSLVSKIWKLIEHASKSTWKKRTADLVKRIESV